MTIHRQQDNEQQTLSRTLGHVYYRKQKRAGWKNSVYAVHNEIENVKADILVVMWDFETPI